jgi:hypothetical protein
MYSGRDFGWLYPRQDQVCFLDGHVRAFAHFDAVPHRLVYDNLRSAVRRMLIGSERELTLRFAALANHYLFEPCFARPATGHDKGGVEARGKGIRWQHLVPIPAGPNLESMSRELLARLDRQAGQGPNLARFEEERGLMLPVPERSFRAARVELVGTTRRSLAKVEGAVYSIPCEWAGRDVTAYVGVDTIDLELPDGSHVIHPRQRFGGRSVDYRHYLPELARKPQAIRQVASELMTQLGEPFATIWRQLVDASGPKDAARQFARVLERVVADGLDVVVARLRRALDEDVPLALALARPVAPSSAVTLDALPASLADIEVVAGSAADYDALVRGEP